jgi:hypothetical protein
MIVDGNYRMVLIELILKFFFSHFFTIFLLAAPTITIDNDENENDAWNEYRHLFENNRSQMLNPSSIDNYLLRHSSANTSLNESTSLEPLIDNHDDIFSMIEQAGITFGK